MAKLFSSEKFLKDSSDLLNLTAPYSLSKRTGPAFYLNQSYRHAQGTTIYGGTSEVHRSMIAERGLGLPRSSRLKRGVTKCPKHRICSPRKTARS